ncbi:MAG TPA: NAD(P)-dependent oxidoreductase [Streptosporangiaceae bacterium]|nr:NAD(P)-dependent oxidoreductase [Streptosporangiaceae bacterium]
MDDPASDAPSRNVRGEIRIGWIGTGRMGGALASRLLRAGHDVAVYNRTPAKAAALAEAGAMVTGTIADLADRDIVFVTVSSDAAFAAVAAEVLAAGPPDILIDCSTVSAEVSAQVRANAAAAGTALLAAPISGNPGAVTAGNATLVVSGPTDAFERAEPVLRVLGRAVTYVGDGEAARLVKLCHNVFLGVVIQSLVEITVLANKAGVSRTAFLEFLNSSVLGSTFTSYKAHALTQLDFTPTFTTSLLRKDLDLGLEAARDLEVPMPLAAMAHQIVQAAIGAGHADQDFAALIVDAARGAGISLQPEDPPGSAS